MYHNSLTTWTIGGGQPAPIPKQGYFEVLVGRRRGRVLQNKGNGVLVEFYATGEREFVKEENAVVSWRQP
jgi:hypothetical protein